MKKRFLVSLGIMLILVIVGLIAKNYLDSRDVKKAWETCASKNPILESNPPQCYDKKGHHWGPPSYKDPIVN